MVYAGDVVGTMSRTGKTIYAPRVPSLFVLALPTGEERKSEGVAQDELDDHQHDRPRSRTPGYSPQVGRG